MHASIRIVLVSFKRHWSVLRGAGHFEPLPTRDGQLTGFNVLYLAGYMYLRGPYRD